jgi:hypothetical protein
MSTNGSEKCPTKACGSLVSGEINALPKLENIFGVLSVPPGD